MQRIKALFAQYREIISYLFFGGLTTLMSIAAFWLFADILHWHYIAANVLSWILCVLFAYYTNRRWVFSGRANKAPQEFAFFVVGRLFSLGGETLLLYVCIDLLGIDNLIAKIIGNGFVIIFNYVFSKFIVFRKKKGETDADDIQGE